MTDLLNWKTGRMQREAAEGLPYGTVLQHHRFAGFGGFVGGEADVVGVF